MAMEHKPDYFEIKDCTFIEKSSAGADLESVPEKKIG